MTAQILDGKALAATIKADLTERVAALAERGITPGLGTVLVGDDPGSHSYVRGKHRDCAQVGIASIQVELPASTSAAELAAKIAELNADPACTGYIVQLPLPGSLDEFAALLAGRPGQGRRRAAPGQPGPAGAGGARVRCRARRAGIVELLRRNGIAAGRRRGLRDRPRHHGGPAARAAADPQERERHGHALPHRHRRRRRSTPGRPTSSSPRPAGPGWSPPTWSSPARSASTSASPVPRPAWSATSTPASHEVASWVAPVPGGVGPMTRAMLLTNVVERAEQLASA